MTSIRIPLANLFARLTQPEWRQFELDVAELTRQMGPDAAPMVEHNQFLTGRISSRPRQVDVLVSGSIHGSRQTIAIECKSSRNPLQIADVDEFAGKLSDLGVDTGVLYAAGGYSAGAKARAAGASQPRIELRSLAPALPNPPWQSGLPELFTGFGDCPNDNCYTGDISWRPWPQEDGHIVEAGSCDICGTWAVRCSECGSANGFLSDEVDCDGCDRRYQLTWDRKGSDVADVVLLTP